MRLERRPEASRSSRESVVAHARPHAGCRRDRDDRRSLARRRRAASSSPTATAPTPVVDHPRRRSRHRRGRARPVGHDLDLVRARSPQRASAAAIRVPLPDISAVEPSGFQIATSARRDLAAGHLEHAVAPDPRVDVAEPPHALRRQRARVGLLDDQVGVAERVPLLEPHREEARPTRECDRARPRCATTSAQSPPATQAVETRAGDPPHPLALVRGVPARAHDDRLERLGSRAARDLLEPERLLARCATPLPASAARTSSTTPRANIAPSARGSAARARPARRRARRSASGVASPSTRAGRCVRPRATCPPRPARAPGRRALAVVRVDGRGGGRVELGEPACAGAAVVVDARAAIRVARLGATAGGTSRSASAARR